MAKSVAAVPRMDESICQHCGRQMPGRLVVDPELNQATANNRTVRLSPRHTKILAALDRTYPRPARVDSIASVLADQGDQATQNKIQVAICQMRPKLASIGVKIFSSGKRTYQLYIGDLSDIPQFDESDVEDLRRALKVLQKARKIIG